MTQMTPSFEFLQDGLTAAEVASNAHHAEVANIITQFDPRTGSTASASNRDSAFDYTPSPQSRTNAMVHPQLADAIRQQQRTHRTGVRPCQTDLRSVDGCVSIKWQLLIDIWPSIVLLRLGLPLHLQPESPLCVQDLEWRKEACTCLCELREH